MSKPSRGSRKAPILGGLALLWLVLSVVIMAGTEGQAAQTDPSPSSQTRGRRTLPDDQVPFVVIGVLTLTIVPVVLGIKAAKRKGVSPHWMWFGLHPVGGWIAYLIIRSRPDKRPAAPLRPQPLPVRPLAEPASAPNPTIGFDAARHAGPAAAPKPEVGFEAEAESKSAKPFATGNLVNRGDRQDDLHQAMAYWIDRMSCPVKDPFVMYLFDTEKDAREALLDLPCIHEGPDRKLICTEPLIFGYYRQSNGLYEAIVCGDKLTHDLWERAKASFESHGGRRKNDLEPERGVSPSPPAGLASPEGVVFVKEERKPTKLGSGTATYRIHQGPDEASARAFLERHPVTEEFDYWIVETPEGNFGRDIQGIYEEAGSRAASVVPGGPPAPALLSPSEWFEALADLCKAYQQNDRAAIDRLEPVATAIGQELNRLGGKAAMLAMWESLECRPGSRTLDMHWHGIGEWLG